MSSYRLLEGDVIELKESHEVYADVPEHFLYSNKKGSFKIAHGNVRISGELSYLAGRYVVYKTTFDGGSTGIGCGDCGYPGGYHVFCESLDSNHTMVDFYQSGHFTAMIESIEPVGRAKRVWVEQSRTIGNTSEANYEKSY